MERAFDAAPDMFGMSKKTLSVFDSDRSGDATKTNDKTLADKNSSTAYGSLSRYYSAKDEDAVLNERGQRLSEVEIADIELAGEVPPPQADLFNQCCLIAAFAILGVYVRIELMQGTPQGYVNYLTSQFIGSFVLGFLFHIKNVIHIDLFAGIGIGFCGSLTTFSSWQVDIVGTLVGGPGAPSNAGGKAYVWFQDQTIGFAVPFAGLTFGKHISESISPTLASLTKRYISIEKTKAALIIKGFSVFSICAAITGVVAGAVEIPGLTAFSLIFAPAGALLRFALSKWMNPWSLKFYWGTFAANILGTIVAGIVYGVSTRYVLSSLSCAALWGVEYGFCGALTTISTFVNEVHTLPRLSYSYSYGFISVLVAQAVLIIIMGGFIWTLKNPFTDPAVCFFVK